MSNLDRLNMQAEIDRIESENAALRAEVEGMREDAERWRTLPAFLEKYQINYVMLLADIDAARKAAQPSAISDERIVELYHTSDDAISFARALLREAPAGWRPIESAPKDGSEVILRVEYRAGAKGGTLVGHYMPGGHCIEDHPPIDEGWYFWNGRRFDKASKPILWMPLPAAPKEGA